MSLADSFLADLDDLSDGENDAPEEGAAGDDMDDEADDLEALNFDDVTSVAKLASSDRYTRIMQRVNAKLEDEGLNPAGADGKIDDDDAHDLVVLCNSLVSDIDGEVAAVHGFLRDKYRPRFPELETLVQHPVDFARVVKLIGGEADVANVDLGGVLPSATIMVVTVTATTSPGRPLSDAELERVLEGCELCLQLDGDKRKVLDFVAGHMEDIAPNLSAALGTDVTAMLIGAAGGINALSKVPACNLQVLGAKKRQLSGFGSRGAAVQAHQGYIYQCEFVRGVPPDMRSRVGRLCAAKAALLARMDAYREHRGGEPGREMQREMTTKIEKWQEPPPAKVEKPLPVPDGETKKRRGGRRLRKMKERYGQTEMMKQQNRLKFSFETAEEEVFEGEEVMGLGMLGQDTGRLRMQMREQGMKMTAKAEKKMAKQTAGRSAWGGASTVGGTRTAVSGLASSLAFTPIQGIELVADGGMKTSVVDGTASYFGEAQGFKTALQGATGGIAAQLAGTAGQNMGPPPPKRAKN